MARAGWAYILASAVALAGMVWRMGWIGDAQLAVAAVVGGTILGLGLLLGILAAVTWVFISIVRLIFGRAHSPKCSLRNGFTQGGPV